MKRFQKKLILFAGVILSLLIGVLINNQLNVSANVDTTMKTIPHYEKDKLDGKDKQDYFIFNPNYKGKGTESKHYKDCGVTKFYESQYMGKYNVWSWKNPWSATPLTELNWGALWENGQDRYGKDANSAAAHFYDKTFSCNLKKGSARDSTKSGYNGDGSGNMIIPDGYVWKGDNLSGRHYEWRYVGYTYAGTAIENPYYPADYPTNTKVDHWTYDTYIDDFWMLGYSEQSPYCPERMIEKNQEQMTAKNPEQSLEYWFNHYLFTDPTVGKGF